MPYTVNDFPVETSEPKIEVSLPEGGHLFELIVEDTAHLQSLPDRVLITVRREQVAPPVITGIGQRFGLLAEPLETIISGQNLRYVSKVALLREGQEDPRVVATILKGGTDGELPIAIRVMGNAAMGARTLKVINPGGETQAEAIFIVVGLPVIDDFLPIRANRGESADFIIRGKNLLIEGEPLGDHQIDFAADATPDPSITAEIKAGSTAKELTVRVEVGRDAAPGKRILRIKTPATQVEAPPKHTFTVLP